MAQVKIYAHSSTISEHREALSHAIHTAIMDALAYPPEKKFQRFLPLDSENFIYPADRSAHYIIIEISMFEGRSVEAKKQLLRALFRNIKDQVGIAPQDVEITLFETPKHHWGIRGVPGDELALNYTVEV